MPASRGPPVWLADGRVEVGVLALVTPPPMFEIFEAQL